jgi:hypothetical protein
VDGDPLLEFRLTLCVSLDHGMAKVNHVVGLIVGNVFTEDHVLIKIPGVENTCGNSDFLDIRVDMMFTLHQLTCI